MDELRAKHGLPPSDLLPEDIVLTQLQPGYPFWPSYRVPLEFQQEEVFTDHWKAIGDGCWCPRRSVVALEACAHAARAVVACWLLQIWWPFGTSTRVSCRRSKRH
jgi:hypothetical protein